MCACFVLEKVEKEGESGKKQEEEEREEAAPLSSLSEPFSSFLVAIAGTSHTVYAPAAGRDDGAAFLVVAPRGRHGEAARSRTLEAECLVKNETAAERDAAGHRAAAYSSIR